MKTISRKLGLIDIDFEDFVNEVLPRTVEGTYEGSTPKEQYADFKAKYPSGKGLFVRKFGKPDGERIAIKFYL